MGVEEEEEDGLIASMIANLSLQINLESQNRNALKLHSIRI